MLKRVLFISLLIFSGMNLLNAQDKILYPETRKGNVVDDYFGKKIADPYRWLEDDNSEETMAWVRQQNAVTNEYLKRIPYREKIYKRLSNLWNYEKRSTPFNAGPYYFYFKNDGIQNQDVLYVQEGLRGEASVLLDPNLLSENGTVALSDIKVSHDGRYVAVNLSEAGSDWNKIRVLSVPEGQWQDDQLEWVKFSNTAWQGNGFYYSRYDAPAKGNELTRKNENQKVYYHKLGTSQSNDQLIFDDKQNPQRTFYAQTTFDERFLIISESETTSGNALYCKDLTKPDSKLIKIEEGFDYDYNVIDNMDDFLLVRTNYNSPNYELVRINPLRPDPKQWQVIIPEKKDQVLESVILSENKIVCTYIKDACNKLEVYEHDGQFAFEVSLPGLGTINSISGKKDNPDLFYSYTSFTHPTTIYNLVFPENKPEVYWEPEMKINPDSYVTKQVFYKSKDGTTIPMFITCKRDIKLDGNNPTLLYGYGGFNISITPSFSVSRLIFLEAGGVYAVPNIRGGGEYGEAWHKAGIKEKKQNVFDDFIAAAQYLIDKKYTSSAKLAIIGGSNGGLLVGACMTQRPDLFKVAIPVVGVLDMLRYQKFTIGWAWVGDFGSSDNKEDFKYLIKYSPLQNIKSGVNYPATLVITGDHDDRVVPAHSFKFIATLQADNASDNPTLIRIDKQIAEAADIYAFMFYNMGYKGKMANDMRQDSDRNPDSIFNEEKKEVKPTIKRP